jgi:uncharacterized protein
MVRPFVVNVREALQHPGTQRQLDLTGPLPGVGLSSARVPDDAEVHVVATIEAQGASVIVQGTAAVAWVGECRRCLGPTDGVVDVDLHEVFEESPVEGETFLLAGDQIDLAPVLAEAVTLGLPLAPLCADDCAGPDPGAHPVGLPSEPDDDEAPGDPRWAVLDQLRADR